MSSQDLLMILVKIFNDALDMNMTSIYVKTVCIETGFTGKLFYKQSEILYFNWYFLINEFKVKSSLTTKHLRCVSTKGGSGSNCSQGPAWEPLNTDI